MRLKNPERLSKRVAAALQDLGNVLELSAVSLAEIAIKTTLGKLRVSAAIARQALLKIWTFAFALHR
jgi:PIN domain nuclease of toxin-antitoxin system